MDQSEFIPKYIKGIKTDVYETGEIQLYNGEFSEILTEKALGNEDKPAVGGGCVSFKFNEFVRNGMLTYAVTEKNTRRSIFGLSTAHTFESLYGKFKKDVDVYYSRYNTKESIKNGWILGLTEKIGGNRSGFGENGNKFYTDIDALTFYVGSNSPKTRQLLFKPGIFKKEG